MPAPGENSEQQFGRYEVVRAIGAGAMGAVYLARDELLGREVAVKTVRPPPSRLAAELFRARFINEARAVAALSHANVVRVFDMGIEGETPYLVMELVAGNSLDHRIEEDGPIDVAAARALGIQIAHALDAAHRQGILHRDVKPANILEDETGTWKLADFGVAHVPDSSITLAGQFVGSPAFAAPESLERGEFDPRSDVYGLGATLYCALGGQPPHAERAIGALGAASGPRPLAELRADVPADLSETIARALSRDPAQRPSAHELAESLASASAPAATVPARPSAAARKSADPLGTAATVGAPQVSVAGHPLGTAATVGAPHASFAGSPAVPLATVAPGMGSTGPWWQRRRSALVLVGGMALALLIGLCAGQGGEGEGEGTRAGVPAAAERTAPVGAPGRAGSADWLHEDGEPPSPRLRELERQLDRGRGRGKGKGKGKRAHEAERRLEKMWREVGKKLRKGDVEEAEEILFEIAGEYPDEEERVREVLEWLHLEYQSGRF